MSRYLIVLAAVAPSLLMLSYAIAKTRGSWRSEAMWHAFFVGALSALAAVGIELVLAGVVKLGHPGLVANAALTAIFVAAIPEEGIKFVALILLAERHVEVRRLQDIIVLGVAVSLGVARRGRGSCARHLGIADGRAIGRRPFASSPRSDPDHPGVAGACRLPCC